MATKKEDLIPSGAEVPADGQTSTEETAEEVEETESTEGTTDETTGEETEDKKTDDAEELKKQIANLEKVLGRQGKELGDLKKQKAQPEEEKPAKDYEALESDIVTKLDEGEIDLKTALRQMNQLASERGAQQATQRFQEEQQKQTSTQMVNQFKESNPDFDEVLESGALDEIIKANPLHDEFSAYHEYKLKQTQADMLKQVEAAKEEGKNEGMKLASGSKGAEKVLGKRGDGLRSQKQTKQPANRAETRSAMLEALKAAREE